MLLIFFNTVMFLLTILALKKIISAFVYTMDVEPLIACVTSCKVICNLSVFTASSILRILLITFCVRSSCSASSSSVVDSSSDMYCQFLFSPRVRMPPPLFLILPLVFTPLPCFFCFSFADFLCFRSSFLFCLGFSACVFSETF